MITSILHYMTTTGEVRVPIWNGYSTSTEEIKNERCILIAVPENKGEK